MENKILLFIPVFNCEKQIARVIPKIDSNIQKYIDEVLIIDNRSSDNTVKVAIAASDSITKKITILQNVENYSLGGSLKHAFLYALENKYTHIITLHGDDQADIRDFLPILINQEYTRNDLIIGARFHPKSSLKGYSLIRILGNRGLNLVCSLIVKKKVYDLIAGLNFFNVSFLQKKVFLNFPNNLTFDSHLLLYAFNENAKIKYTPITWCEEDQISNAKVVHQAITILKLLFSYLRQGSAVFLFDKSGNPKGFTYPSTTVFTRPAL